MTTLRDVMRKIENLPALSNAAVKLGAMTRDPDTSVRDIVEVMRSDPGISAKVMRLVNSSYYAIPGGVTDVGRAVSFLGLNTLYQLVLTVSVVDTLRMESCDGFDPEGLWIHSLGVGACAEMLADRVKFKEPSTCFTAGLLHDIGKIALAVACLPEYVDACSVAAEQGLPMYEAERLVGLPAHHEVGARLAKRWKFPMSLRAPIQLHHVNREKWPGSVTPVACEVTELVTCADEITRFHTIGTSGSVRCRDPQSAAAFAISSPELNLFGRRIRERIAECSVFLSLISGRQKATGSSTTKQAPGPSVSAM